MIQKWLLTNISVLLIAFVLSLFLAEISIRLLGLADHLYTEPAFELSPQGDYWRYKRDFKGTVLGPTHVNIGPFGSRLNDTVMRSSNTGEVTVAVFGDSVTFGQGVEDHLTFTAQLEKKLLDAKVSTTVLNFGVSGHSLEMEIAHLADRLSQVNPDVVVLAFISDDLDPEREQNHVDRFGYLTKKIFGPSSIWLDYLRAGLRESHLALLAKSTLLSIRKSRKPHLTSISTLKSDRESRLLRFSRAMKRFDNLTVDIRRIVICLNMRETPISKGIQAIMKQEFQHLTYVHAPPAFETFPPHTLQVPRDGHPNATAHAIYAELLWHRLEAAVWSSSLAN